MPSKRTLIPTAILTTRKSGGTPLDFQKFTLEDVRISGVDPIGSGGYHAENV
jgi:type VI protein secretion system component Hcp